MKKRISACPIGSMDLPDNDYTMVEIPRYLGEDGANVFNKSAPIQESVAAGQCDHVQEERNPTSLTKEQEQRCLDGGC